VPATGAFSKAISLPTEESEVKSGSEFSGLPVCVCDV